MSDSTTDASKVAPSNSAEKSPVAEDTEEKATDNALATDENALNFKAAEIKTLLVPVPRRNRFIAIALVVISFGFVCYLQLNGPLMVATGAEHIIKIKDPGTYLLVFKGDVQDPYGWTETGRFRKSLDIEPENERTHDLIPQAPRIKDLSGAGHFSVAEYDIYEPGTYKISVNWLHKDDICDGMIALEKDPVERFFMKWFFGIVGTIAFFYMIGIPMTTRTAQSTLPGANGGK